MIASVEGVEPVADRPPDLVGDRLPGEIADAEQPRPIVG